MKKIKIVSENETITLEEKDFSEYFKNKYLDETLVLANEAVQSTMYGKTLPKERIEEVKMLNEISNSNFFSKIKVGEYELNFLLDLYSYTKRKEV